MLNWDFCFVLFSLFLFSLYGVIGFAVTRVSLSNWHVTLIIMTSFLSKGDLVSTFSLINKNLTNTEIDQLNSSCFSYYLDCVHLTSVLFVVVLVVLIINLWVHRHDITPAAEDPTTFLLPFPLRETRAGTEERDTGWVFLCPITTQTNRSPGLPTISRQP